MILYVGNSNEKDLEELKNIVENLEVVCNKKDLLKHGFTNCYKPIFYFCRILTNNNPYQVSFNINISSKTLKIKSIEILDEQFCQPCPTNKTYNEKIKNYIDELIKQGVLIKKEV